MNFIAQIIGSLAISIWVLSLQSKQRSKLLKLQSLANLLYFFEYILLGAFSAASMNLTSSIRCLLFSKRTEEETKIWNIIFIIIIFILGIITYNGLLSLIPIIITSLYTISSSKNDTKYNRIVVLTSAFIWTYYNYKVKAYITILGNVFEIISGIISLIRFKQKEI